MAEEENAAQALHADAATDTKEDAGESEEQPPLLPVGICLSGGGYRAAAFHLGALSYLHHLGWEKNLRMLSTVSGGTFVGARYAVSQVAGESFGEFFRSFYEFLRDADLVKLGLRRLAQGAVDVPSGRQDLIVSMAEIYARTFLAKDDGSPWLFGEILDALDRIDLDEVAFNTTEFRTGVDFRFQSSGRIGNGNVSIPRDVASQLRLADVTAMSSCFPGGFGPVAFPFDVHWPGGEVPEDVGDAFFHPDGSPRPLAVMDGGIYDNQGLEALILADGRAKDRGESGLGTIIVSDVDQPNDDLYPYPELEEPTGPTVDTGVKLGWIFAVFSLLTFVFVATHLVLDVARGTWSVVDLATQVTSLVLSGGVFGVLVYFRHEMRKALRRLPQVGLHAWRDLRKLKLETLAEMLYTRAGSLLAMASSIFMKRIRQLIDSEYYGRPEYRTRLVSNYVYLLTQPAMRSRLSRIPGVVVPTEGSALHRVAEAAATMATTLWFVPHRGWCQPSLVASGQASLVYALLQNLYVRNGNSVPKEGEEAELWERLREDAKRFRDEPYWLLARIRPGDYRLPPVECSCADALLPADELLAAGLGERHRR